MFEDRPGFDEIPKPEARRDELEYRVQRVEPNDAVPILIERLADTYPPIRHLASDELAALLADGELSDERADSLINICRAVLDGDKQRVGELLAGIGGIEEDLEVDASVRQSACRILAGAGGSVLEDLEGALDDPHADVRYRALVSIHDIDLRALEGSVLANLLDDDDPEVQTIAAQWLAERGERDQLERLLEAWRASRKPYRMTFALAAAELLGSPDAVADPDTRRELVNELIDALDDERTAPAATRALVSMDVRQAIQPLKDLIDGWFIHPIIRVQAAAALVEFGESRGYAYLEKALDHRRRDVSGAAIRAIGRLQLDDYMRHLEELATSDDYHADTAVLALAEWGSDRAREVLEVVAEHRADSPAGRLAERALVLLRASGRVDADRLQFATGDVANPVPES